MENDTSLKTSVVLASFNGEEYIEEQLMSIYKQTQKVNEVLIVDDRSTDSTVEICKRFIKDKQPKNWSIKVNEVQLGVFQNFLNGILYSRGDVIFFADQDDVWLEEKVSVMVDKFKQNPDMLSLTTTFSRFENDVVYNKHVRHPHRKSNGLKKIQLNEYCNFPYYLGMSTAISKELIRKIDFTNELFKNIDKLSLVHDIFFNFISTINNGHYHLDMVLTKRRSYSKSVSNLKFTNELEPFNGNKNLCSINDKIKQLEIFTKLLGINNNKENINYSLRTINDNLKVLKLRFNYFKNINLILWAKGIKYLRDYNSYLIYFADGFKLIKDCCKKI